MIPEILYRTVPEQTDAQTEEWWTRSVELTPGWDHITYRDGEPGMVPEDWLLTGHLWASCQNGAQKADLIRVEAAMRHGGVYLDADAELVRDPAPLLAAGLFAAWEDKNTIPNAVFGAVSDHPALPELLAGCIANVGIDTWQGGPGTWTRVLKDRDDVLILPPAALFPYHWDKRQKRTYDPMTALGRRNLDTLIAQSPWTVSVHHWRHSWA